jgi:hypothetical protein
MLTACMSGEASDHTIQGERRQAFVLVPHHVRVQDVVRVGSKLRRLQLHKLCMHFDWMDGSSPHVPATQLTLLLKLVVTCTCIGALESHTGSASQIALTTVAAIILIAWVPLQVPGSLCLPRFPCARSLSPSMVLLLCERPCFVKENVLSTRKTSHKNLSLHKLHQRIMPFALYLQGNLHVKPAIRLSSGGQGSTRRARPLPLRMFQPAPTTLNPFPDPVTPFVVLATQRTGSNTLCGHLNGVHGIAMHNELFNDKGVFTHIGKHNLPTTSIYKRDAQPGRFLVDALSVDPLSKVSCPCQEARFLWFQLARDSNS